MLEKFKQLPLELSVNPGTKFIAAIAKKKNPEAFQQKVFDTTISDEVLEELNIPAKERDLLTLPQSPSLEQNRHFHMSAVYGAELKQIGDIEKIKKDSDGTPIEINGYDGAMLIRMRTAHAAISLKLKSTGVEEFRRNIGLDPEHPLLNPQHGTRGDLHATVAAILRNKAFTWEIKGERRSRTVPVLPYHNIPKFNPYWKINDVKSKLPADEILLLALQEGNDEVLETSDEKNSGEITPGFQRVLNKADKFGVYPLSRLAAYPLQKKNYSDFLKKVLESTTEPDALQQAFYWSIYTGQNENAEKIHQKLGIKLKQVDANIFIEQYVKPLCKSPLESELLDSYRVDIKQTFVENSGKYQPLSSWHKDSFPLWSKPKPSPSKKAVGVEEEQRHEEEGSLQVGQGATI